MQITNKFNLPETIYKAVSKVYAPNPDRLSVTDLIGPPLIRQLKIKHWDELQEDASDRLWALLGQSVHYILDSNADPNALTEEKLEHQYNGLTIVGKSDNYKDGVITDYKVTSVWSYLLGGHKDWETQLNCYAWLWGKHNFLVANLIVNAILRDWQRSKLRDPDYPRIPFVCVGLPLWEFGFQEEYIKSRVELHKAEPLECTPEEKWEKPTTHAVMKKGRKSALRVLDSQDSALEWINKNGLMRKEYEDESTEFICEPKPGISIAERPGEYTRCKSYCPVRSVCPFNKEMK